MRGVAYLFFLAVAVAEAAQPFHAFGGWANPWAWGLLFCPQPWSWRHCTYKDVSPRFAHLWRYISERA